MTALFFAVIGMIYSRTHTVRFRDGRIDENDAFHHHDHVHRWGLCSLGLPGLGGFVAEMTIFIGSLGEGGYVSPGLPPSPRVCLLW